MPQSRFVQFVDLLVPFFFLSDTEKKYIKTVTRMCNEPGLQA